MFLLLDHSLKFDFANRFITNRAAQATTLHTKSKCTLATFEAKLFFFFLKFRKPLPSCAVAGIAFPIPYIDQK
jgi:hypothetical protein